MNTCRCAMRQPTLESAAHFDPDDPEHWECAHGWNIRLFLCPDWVRPKDRATWTLEPITWEVIKTGLACCLCFDNDATVFINGRFPVCEECADPQIFERRLPPCTSL